MVNRREFFSGFLKPDRKKPALRAAREPRYRHLETCVVADRIPPDRTLTPEQDQELRIRIRKMVEAASDPDLFSMTIVRKLEKLAEEFLREIESPPTEGA